MFTKRILTAILVLLTIGSSAQNVAINQDASLPDGSAMLDVKSTTRGLLIPRMTENQRDLITLPATGLLIYQSNNAPGFYYNSGTPAAPVWTSVSVNTSGTADYVSKFTSGTALGNSQIYDNGTFVGINATGPVSGGAEKFRYNQIVAPGTYGGMGISTSSATGMPFLSYSNNGGLLGWHYFDGTDNNRFKLFSHGDTRITVDSNVGIGVTALIPQIRLQVFGYGGNTIRGVLSGTPATAIATAGSIYGESNTGIGVIGVSGTQNGVYGLSTGTLGGTVGVNTGTGNAIWGAYAGSGSGTAGYFDAGISPTARGIAVISGYSSIGEAPVAPQQYRLSVIQPTVPVPATDTFPAFYAYSQTTEASRKGGVYGTYNGSNYGTGVQGIGWNGIPNSEAISNFGVGNQDLGVYGSANTAGVMGASVNGIGVLGHNKNGSFAATTGGGNSYGVYGYANTIGGATPPATRYGVYAYATGATTNYAGYFSGDVQISGNISKGSGTFKIDHPLDPENKYLYHSFVESPDMMNIYNGNVTTDANGYSTVEMPAYFDALNKEFRYQLTVIGTFAQAIIKEEMNGNQFVIQTSQPGVKVSWQVTGVRKDKYANAHRVVPEVEKEAAFKGYYLHAKEYGQPDSRSIDALTRPKTGDESFAEEKKAATDHQRGDTAAPAAPNGKVAGAEIKTGN